MAEAYRSTAKRLSDGQERLANRISQQRTTDEGGIGLLTTFLGPARYGASTAIRSFDDIRNLLGVLSTANKTNPVRKLVANELAAEQLAKRVVQPTALNAAKRAAALVPVAGTMQAGSGEGPQSLPSIRNMGPETGVYGAIPGRPGTEVYAGVDAPPIPTPSPDAALKLGLIGGEAVAQDRNQGNLLSGLLGDIDYKGILNQLIKTFQRPEMLTPGVNALTAFGMSGAALNQAEIAGAAAEQERMDKFALEQIKNAPGAPSFNSTQTELFQSVSQGSQVLDSLQRAKEILLQSKITGAGPGAIEVGKNILKAFGIDPGVGGRKEYEQKVAELKAYVSGQRVFGREMNKQELKILDTLASNPGLFNSNSELMGQLDAFIRRVNTTVGTNRRILEQQGFGQASRFINEPPTSVFRD